MRKTLLFSLLFIVNIVSAQNLLLRGPYIQKTGENGTIINWRSLLPGTAHIKVGASPDNLNMAFTGTSLGLIDHKVEAKDLLANTKYYYQIFIGDDVLGGNVEEQHFTTAPKTASKGKVKMWVLGDSGMDNAFHANSKAAYDNFRNGDLPDLVLMLGDNAYLTGQDIEYDRGLFGIHQDIMKNVAYFPAYGNHDSYGSPLFETGPYFSVFDLPANGELGGEPSKSESYYAYNYANIHFVVLDANMAQNIVNGDEMLQWLQRDLENNTQDWIIAYWHHPPYTKGSHDSDTEGELIDARTNILPILETYGVDLVMGGHSHCYERSKLIKGHFGDSDSFDEKMVISQGNGSTDGAYLKGFDEANSNNGTVYMVAGATAQQGGGSLDHKAMFVSENIAGTVLLEVEDNVLTSKYLSSEGEIIDEFSIIKNESILSIETNENAFGLMIKSNASAKNLEFLVNNSNQQLHYNIISTEGKIHLYGNIENNSTKVNIEKLSSGMYLLNVMQSNGLRQSKKFYIN